MEYVKVNHNFACEVGDIFEYPKTGEYEKYRGERIVILEKGDGCNPDHTYVRVLSFRPKAEENGFHFSCYVKYMDTVLEHWRFIGHVDISAVTNPEKFTDTCSGQAEYDARNKVKTADDVLYLVKAAMHGAMSYNGMWTINYISTLLHLVYGSGMKYDVECLFFDILDYARSACYPEDLTRALKIVSQMPFASKFISGGERFGQPSFQSIYDAAKLMNEAKAHITMGGRFTVKDLRDLTEVRTSTFAKPAEYVYGWDQYSLFDDTLIYEDPDESGVYRICIPAPRRLKTTITKDDLAQAEEISEMFKKCVMAMGGKEKMDENAFEVGDVLEMKGTYVLANDSVGKINRGLVIRSFTDELSEAVRYYVILVIPTEFHDEMNFTFKTKVRTLTEGFLNKNSKKIDHVDLTPFVM